MLGHLGSGLAEGGVLELPCRRLSAARPPREGKEGRFLSIPGVLGGQQMGRAGGPKMCCAKARSDSKVLPAVLGGALPLPPSRSGLQAHCSRCPSPLRGDCVLGEDTSGLNPGRAQAWDTCPGWVSGFCSELNPEDLGSFLALHPPWLLFPEPALSWWGCVLCSAVGVGVGGWDHAQQDNGAAVPRFRGVPHCGAERKQHQLDFSNDSSPPFFLSPPASNCS